jgi:hypothetical protein
MVHIRQEEESNMENVNLDALIQREDFEVEQDGPTPQLSQTIKISDLEENAFFYTALRKPDFQRETSDWDPAKIASFIQSFLDGDLIPAIILWNSGGYTFVIDGSHRLSALLAWVHDDYGDGFISQRFFNHEIDKEQKRIAEKTRRATKAAIGTFQDCQKSIRSPENADQTVLGRARKLGYLSIQLQWVSGGADKAEASFFKINQQATPIDETEIELLKSRRKPHAVAARAIIRAGTGHKYWSKFEQAQQDQIVNIAREINGLLFTPPLKTPIKTLDLPLAGQGYSARSLALVFDLVKIANEEVGSVAIDDDPDGSTSIAHLKAVRRALRVLTGTHPSSVGLHPAVYFYSKQGRYQPTAFLAVVHLLKGLVDHGELTKFIKVRQSLEDFILVHKHYINQLTYKYGSILKGYRQVGDLLKLCIDVFAAKERAEDVSAAIENKYPFLQPDVTSSGVSSGKFSSGTKSETFLRHALETAVRCRICGGFIHTGSITIDHVERREDGGSNAPSNAQLTHPYCNSTVKG